MQRDVISLCCGLWLAHPFFFSCQKHSFELSSAPLPPKTINSSVQFLATVAKCQVHQPQPHRNAQNSTQSSASAARLPVFPPGASSQFNHVPTSSPEQPHSVHSLDPSTKIQREHNGAVNSVDIDQAEGKYLLSGGGDGTVHLYDLEVSTRKERTIIASIAMTPRNYHGHVGGVSQVAWYPFDNGMFTTSSYDSTIKVWDSNSMQDACTFNLESKVYAHAMSSIATHGLIASATADPKIRLCDLRSGAFTHSLSAHRGTVLAVEWSPRHDYLLASGSTDSTMRLWDIRKSNSCLISFDFHNSGADRLADSNAAHTRAVNGVTFTPDGLHLVSNGLDDRIRLWSVVSGENTLVNFGSAFRNQFVHNVRPIITPLSAGPFHIFLPSDNHSILVYNLLDGTLVKTLSGAFGRINGLTWRPQSEDIYTAGNDHEILVWAPANTQIDEVQKALADQDAWSDSDGQD